MADKKLNLLEDIEKGMSPSYLGRFNRIVGLDIDSAVGTVSLQPRLTAEFPYWGNDAFTGRTFTVSAANDTLDIGVVPGTIWEEGMAVELTTTTTLPAPLAVNTIYYVISFSGNTLKLASSLANLASDTPVDIADTGTGTHTITAKKMREVKKFATYGDDKFLLDSGTGGQNVWLKSSSYKNVWTCIRRAGDAIDMEVWNKYLIVKNNTNKVHAFGAITNLGTAAWTDDFATTSGSFGTNPMKVMSNNILYIGGSLSLSDGQGYIDSLEENTGETFAPGTGATFTYSQKALLLPKGGSNPTFLEEYNMKLAIGTGIANSNNAKIFLWDTISPSFDAIIDVKGSWVLIMKAYNGTLYFITSDSGIGGTDGSIYASNGYSVQKVGQLPKSTNNSQQARASKSFAVQRYSMMEWNDRFYIGVSNINTTFKGAGIYEFNPNTGSISVPYRLASLDEGVPGSGADGTTVRYGAFLPLENSFYVGCYQDTYDGELFTLQTFHSAYRLVTPSYLETGLWTIGDKYQPKTFRYFEIQLGKEMASGDVITLYYRNNLTDSYTTIGTMSFANDGAVATKIIENSAVSGDQIQFKVQVESAATATAGPELKTIYVY